MNLTPSSTVTSDSPRRTARLEALAVLFKLRVVWLLLFAAIGGAFLAAGGWPGAGRLLALVVSGGLTAAGASAINQYLERDADALMARTRERPLVNGTLTRPGAVLAAAIAFTALPPLVVFFWNPALALWELLGAIIYLGVYTIWLKPRTLLNIVIGGAAGSAAVLSGSAAAGEWNAAGAVVLALLVFLWTPTHFWSLAIIHRGDYALSGVPMLPVQTTPKAAAGWVLLHTAASAVAAIGLSALPALGWLYAAPVGAATAVLLRASLRLVHRPGQERARLLFKLSNIHLGIVLLFICIDLLI